MYVMKGGEQYGFCPGKATWDAEATSIFSSLVVTAETGAMLKAGGLEDQPGYWVDLLSEFLPRYSDQRFIQRAKMVMGDGRVQSVLNQKR